MISKPNEIYRRQPQKQTQWVKSSLTAHWICMSRIPDIFHPCEISSSPAFLHIHGGTQVGPKRDHVPGRKNGTRYLVPSPVVSRRTGPGCWSRLPSVRKDGTRYLVPSPVLSGRTGPGCWSRLPLVTKDGTRYLAPSPVLSGWTGPGISTGLATGLGKD